MIGGMVPAACASRSRCTSCSLPPAGLSPRPRLMMRRSLSMMLLKSSGQDMCLVGGASSAGAAGGAASPARIPALLVPKMSCPVFSARFRSEIPRWAKASLPMFSSPPPKPVPCIAFCLATIDSERCLGTLSSTMSPRRLIESVPPTALEATGACGGTGARARQRKSQELADASSPQEASRMEGSQRDACPAGAAAGGRCST
mmetsp:Transcript_5414/g.18287  ORF Transcript_5414/g.18287 Transcript_5414/m.18287 type:complete len:202 (-) Transcript_5414:227-832(-)